MLISVQIRDGLQSTGMDGHLTGIGQPWTPRPRDLRGLGSKPGGAWAHASYFFGAGQVIEFTVPWAPMKSGASVETRSAMTIIEILQPGIGWARCWAS